MSSFLLKSQNVIKSPKTVALFPRSWTSLPDSHDFSEPLRQPPTVWVSPAPSSFNHRVSHPASPVLIVCFVVWRSPVQTMNDDLNASLASADELDKEFSSMLHEASSGPIDTRRGFQVHTHTHTCAPHSNRCAAMGTLRHCFRLGGFMYTIVYCIFLFLNPKNMARLSRKKRMATIMEKWQEWRRVWIFWEAWFGYLLSLIAAMPFRDTDSPCFSFNLQLRLKFKIHLGNIEKHDTQCVYCIGTA